MQINRSMPIPARRVEEDEGEALGGGGVGLLIDCSKLTPESIFAPYKLANQQ